MGWVQGIVEAFRKMKNDRLYRRLPAESINVRIVPKGDGSPMTRKIANWSPGGLYVPTKEVLPLETHVHLEIALATTGSSALQLEGQVVRHQRHPVTEEIEGMGIMFTNFTQSGLTVLRDLLLNASKTESGN
jgi:hypothetical protein